VTYRLSFELPGLPARANRLLGASKFTKHKNASVWKRAVVYTTMGKLPPEPLTRVKLTLVRCNYRTLDYDSAVMCFKPVVDGLVVAGVLKNDTWAITGKWDVDQEYAPKSEAKLKITVEEIT
jgi:hypothetical protein